MKDSMYDMYSSIYCIQLSSLAIICERVVKFSIPPVDVGG